MVKLSLALLSAPLALAAIAAPVAASADETRSVVVRYDDLDLANPSGRERLTTRVANAVKNVCGTKTFNRQMLAERASAKRCEADTRVRMEGQLASLFDGAVQVADSGGIAVAAR